MVSVMAKDLHELLQCDICCEQMKNPRVLNCQHTFCQTCLLRWQNQQPDKNFISCPTCRMNTYLASGTFVGLKRDRRQEQLAGVVKQLEEPHCEVCSGSPIPEKASSFCRNCQDCMCCKCAEAHMKFPLFEDHELISIREFKNNDEFCQEHPHKSKDFYCEECDVLICSLCTTKGHQQHIELVHSAAKYCEGFISQIKNLMIRADRQQDQLWHLQELKKNISDTKLKVEEHVNSIIKGIKTQEAEILASLDEKATTLEMWQNWAERTKALKPDALKLSKKYGTYLRTGKPADLLVGIKDLYTKVKRRVSNCGEDFPILEVPLDFASGQQQHFSIGKVVTKYKWDKYIKSEEPLVPGYDPDDFTPFKKQRFANIKGKPTKRRVTVL